MTPHDRWNSTDIAMDRAQHSTLDRIDEWKRNAPDDTREYSSGPWKYPPRVPDPEGRAPEGAAIFIGAIVMLLVFIAGASIFAPRIF